MRKKVSLSVHKNSIERRRRHELEKELKCSILPMWSFPAVVKDMLQRDMEESGIEEDWKPVLPVKVSE